MPRIVSAIIPKVKNFQTNYKFPHEIKSFGDYKLDVIIPDKSEYKKGKIFEVVVQLYGDGFLEDTWFRVYTFMKLLKRFQIL